MAFLLQEIPGGKERTLPLSGEAAHLPNAGTTSRHSGIFPQTWIRRSSDGSHYPFLESENEKKPSRQPNLWQDWAHGVLPPCELLLCELWTGSDVQWASKPLPKSRWYSTDKDNLTRAVSAVFSHSPSTPWQKRLCGAAAWVQIPAPKFPNTVGLGIRAPPKN